jgi:ABC-2 type transport system ATP-binding protein
MPTEVAATGSETEPAGRNATAGSAAPPDAISVRGLSHTYPATGWRQSQPALADLSFEVEPGEIVAILGPNGGGKTTLFRILATMLTPYPKQPGAARIFGYDVAGEAHAVRQQIGMVFQSPSLDGKLTAAENLRHQGRLYGLRGLPLKQRIDEALKQFALTDRANERVERFSGGMRRRVELAKALLHQPRLLLMDEPATGLDPAGRRELANHLTRLKAQGTTIALTTHLMDEADRCDRVAILDEGRLRAFDTPGTLKGMIGGEVVTIEPTEMPDNSPKELARLIEASFGPFESAAAPRAVGQTVRFETVAGPELIADLSQELPARLQRVTVGQPTLEDVFLHLTGEPLA